MGLFGRIAAVKGAVEGPLTLQTNASEIIKTDAQSAFEIGTRLDVLPREVGRLCLRLDHLTGEQLRMGDELYVVVDLLSFEGLADLLRIRLGLDSAGLQVPMGITRLEQQAIRLEGVIDKLGGCSLDIALRERDRETQADVALAVVVEPIDIRVAAATQRGDIEKTLGGSIYEFAESYKDNIHARL